MRNPSSLSVHEIKAATADSTTRSRGRMLAEQDQGDDDHHAHA